MLQISYREKETKGQIEQIKMCRKKQHNKIDDVKEMSDLICGKSAVGGNYKKVQVVLEYLVNQGSQIAFFCKRGDMIGKEWEYDR